MVLGFCLPVGTPVQDASAAFLRRQRTRFIFSFSIDSLNREDSYFFLNVFTGLGVLTLGFKRARSGAVASLLLLLIWGSIFCGKSCEWVSMIGEGTMGLIGWTEGTFTSSDYPSFTSTFPVWTITSTFSTVTFFTVGPLPPTLYAFATNLALKAWTY